jgi:hypothetical protein
MDGGSSLLEDQSIWNIGRLTIHKMKAQDDDFSVVI